jgi:hypothetical protein
LAFPIHQKQSPALGISSASCLKYPAKQEAADALSSKSCSAEDGHSLDLPHCIIARELLGQAMSMVEQIIQLRQKTQKICPQPGSHAIHCGPQQERIGQFPAKLAKMVPAGQNHIRQTDSEQVDPQQTFWRRANR